MSVDRIVIRTVSLRLKEPFRTSIGTVTNRDQIIIEMHEDGVVGYGEVAVFPFPFYTHEDPTIALHVLQRYLIPLFFKANPLTPQAVAASSDQVVGHRMAKAGLELAFWDLIAKKENVPLWKLLGGEKQFVPVGISLPIYPTTSMLLERVNEAIQRGYQRVKIKITRGEDRKLIEAVYDAFPNVPLMVDANAAYTLQDLPFFKALDQFPLMMIEQPLRAGDLLDHATLQSSIQNSICLDESIEDRFQAEAAVKLQSGKIFNVKLSKVGGHSEAKLIHDYAHSQGIGVWCGGMLETGIGRAHNIALATLPNFLYPGDISESARYYERDLIDPPVVMKSNGTVAAPHTPGIGYAIDTEFYERVTTNRIEIRS